MMDNWTHVTSKKITENKRRLCAKCKFSGLINNDYKHVSAMTCDYILIMKHSRGCSPIDCKKFEPRTRKRPKEALRFSFNGE